MSGVAVSATNLLNQSYTCIALLLYRIHFGFPLGVMMNGRGMIATSTARTYRLVWVAFMMYELLYEVAHPNQYPGGSATLVE